MSADGRRIVISGGLSQGTSPADGAAAHAEGTGEGPKEPEVVGAPAVRALIALGALAGLVIAEERKWRHESHDAAGMAVEVRDADEALDRIKVRSGGEEGGPEGGSSKKPQLMEIPEDAAAAGSNAGELGAEATGRETMAVGVMSHCLAALRNLSAEHGYEARLAGQGAVDLVLAVLSPVEVAKPKLVDLVRRIGAYQLSSQDQDVVAGRDSGVAQSSDAYSSDGDSDTGVFKGLGVFPLECVSDSIGSLARLADSHDARQFLPPERVMPVLIPIAAASDDSVLRLAMHGSELAALADYGKEQTRVREVIKAARRSARLVSRYDPAAGPLLFIRDASLLTEEQRKQLLGRNANLQKLQSPGGIVSRPPTSDRGMGDSDSTGRNTPQSQGGGGSSPRPQPPVGSPSFNGGRPGGRSFVAGGSKAGMQRLSSRPGMRSGMGSFMSTGSSRPPKPIEPEDNAQTIVVEGAYGDAFREDDLDDIDIEGGSSGAIQSQASGRQGKNKGFSVDGATAARIKADRRLGGSARSQCALALSALACGDVDVVGEHSSDESSASGAAAQGGAALLRHSTPEQRVAILRALIGLCSFGTEIGPP